MKKTIKIIVIITSMIFVLLIGLFFSSEWLFPEWNGSYNLGNNLYMMEWDGGGKIIVYCSNKKGRTCYGGPNVVPTYEREYDSLGNFAELVENVKFNNEWIIVKSKLIKKKKYHYYIINKDFDINGFDWETVNCDSIIQSHITEYIDSVTFIKELERRNIDLSFSE
jgi:hypothetical protein